MKKEEFVRRYGEEKWEKGLQRDRDQYAKHPEEKKAKSQEQSRKGGKRYEKKKQYAMIGIPHKKKLVRRKHQHRYGPYKKIIVPDSELHHSWKNDGTAGYIGVALVEKDQHRHGYIDVIQILEGEITLLTEAEIRGS